ncbi:MAG TPA: O-antigen ligase family protein, partial [candidate division Zixibacteria bacterium]|nr:O-antigen ligase family protein [candidate division Zixibacteria bacterium]
SGLLVALPFPYHILPFALLGVVVFVIGTLRYPYFGLYLYLIIFFMDPNQIFPFMQTVAFPYEKVLAFAVIGILLIHIAILKKEFDLYRLDVGFAAMILATYLSILGAVDLAAAWEDWQRFLRLFLVYLVMVRIVKTEGQLKAIIMLFIISIGFLAISSTIQYYRGEFEVRQGIQRLHSFGGGLIDPNTMASSLVLGVPFMFYMAKAHRSALLKLFMFALIGSCFWAIMLTGSRGGMVGGIALMLLLVWHSRHKTLGFVVAFAVLVCIAAVMPDQYQNRFMSIFRINEQDEFGASDSARGRINGFKLGFKFLLKNPLTGVGISNFGWHHHLEPNGDWTDAHNLVGKLVGELGLIGVAAFSFFIARFAGTLKLIKRLYDEHGWPPDFLFQMRQAIKIGLIMLFVQGLFGHNLFRDNWYFTAGFIVIVSKIVWDRHLAAQRPSGATPGSPEPLPGAEKGLLPG